jgi:hypothetical protein
MKRLITTSLFAVILLGASMHARPVRADTGPKPTMDFQFTFDPSVGQASIVSGILYECDESDCNDAAPLEELGPQGLYCELESCRAIGYGFAPHHILEIEFSDGATRRSNTFETDGFDSFYAVTVRVDDLLVEPRINPLAPPFWLIILITCACVIVGGGLLIGLVLFLRRRARA